MEIIEVVEQEGKPKRFMLIISEYGKLKKYQFGQPNGKTFIDGATLQVRDNYRKRHLANKTEYYRITNLIPSASLFSYYILWGDTQDIVKNIELLNEMFLQIKGGSIPLDKKLYEDVKKLADNRYAKSSAYKSGYIVKTYKELGGKYSGDKTKEGLTRWFQEDWQDIGNKSYPVFRPTKIISSKTPLTKEEISPSNLKKQIELKQKIKGKKNLPPFSELRN